MNRIMTTRMISGALIVALTYTPVLGNVTGTIAAAQTTQNTTFSYQYDANGNLRQISDPLGHVTDLTIDPLNREKQRQLPAPVTNGTRPIINYGYDGIDQITSVGDPRNLSTSYTRDGLGNQSVLASPDTGTAGMTFDVAGNLKTRTDARGKTTTYNYDVLNRLTSATYANGTASVFEYDGGTPPVISAVGRLTRMSDESGETRYGYDPMGRLASVAQTISAGGSANTYSVTYAYGSEGSATGRLASATYPSGNRINYAYDSTGRIASVSLNPGLADGSTNTGLSISLVTAIQYAPTGSISGWAWGNSTPELPNIVTRTFDLDGRMISYPLGSAVQRTLTYDAANRITAMTHSGAGTGANDPANLNQSFGYDNLDRLISYTAVSTSQAYQYDINGNRKQATFGASVYTSVVSSTSNRLTSAAGPLPAKVYSYDAAGNVIGDGTSTFTYSDRGRMSTASKAGVTTSYFYNGAGQRVRKASAALGTTDFVYDEQGHLLGEYAAGSPVQETVFLGDVPINILKKSNDVNAASLYDVYNVYSDHLSTPRVIASAADNFVVWRWDSDPFGMVQPQESPSGGAAFGYNARYPGQYYDRETSLHYNYFRDYDQQTGRYVESDPVGLRGGINTYAYVGGNPVSRIDPIGLWATDAHNYFIDIVFRNLDPAIRDIIKNGSAHADSMEFQDPAHAHMHAMSSSAMTPAQAKRAMCQYIKDNMSDANDAKNNNDAHYWFLLGMALHPVMDSTSPSHEGFQEWHGVMADGSKHGPWPSSLENISVARRPEHSKRTTDAMRRALDGDLGGCGCN